MKKDSEKHYKKYKDILKELRSRVINLRQEGKVHFPAERDLALQLEAGRPTIAKALRCLKNEGLLERSKGGNRIPPFKQRFRYAYLACTFKVNDAFWFPAYQRLWDWLERLSREKKINVELFKFGRDYNEDPSTEKETLDQLKNFDVIFMSLIGAGCGAAMAQKLRSLGSKVFILNENDETPGFPLYCLGDFAVGELAAKTFFERGYRKTAIIAPMVNLASIDFFRRVEGFTQTMRVLGGSFELFASNMKSQMDELLMMQRCIDRLPDQGFDSAFFLCDNWISLAENLIQMGRTPDFGILAFDGTMKARSHMPPIDTLTHGTISVAQKIVSTIEDIEAGVFQYDPNECIRFAPDVIRGKTLLCKK